MRGLSRRWYRARNTVLEGTISRYPPFVQRVPEDGLHEHLVPSSDFGEPLGVEVPDLDEKELLRLPLEEQLRHRLSKLEARSAPRLTTFRILQRPDMRLTTWSDSIVRLSGIALTSLRLPIQKRTWGDSSTCILPGMSSFPRVGPETMTLGSLGHMKNSKLDGTSWSEDRL